MGCDIHCVLQKQNERGDWETVMVDFFPMRHYELFDYLSNVRGMHYTAVAHDGLPDDFPVGPTAQGDNYHRDFWMGDHSFGWCTIQEFIDGELPPPPSLGDKYSIAKEEGRIIIDLDRDDEADESYEIRALQLSFINIFGESFTWDNNGTEERQGAQLYRLVFGYDS